MSASVSGKTVVSKCRRGERKEKHTCIQQSYVLEQNAALVLASRSPEDAGLPTFPTIVHKPLVSHEPEDLCGGSCDGDSRTWWLLRIISQLSPELLLSRLRRMQLDWRSDCLAMLMIIKP